jgi:predicted phage baseplate assembly protein
MPLPSPNLDDLRFQRDLVDEARRRIIRYCPEWTDYNLSDPGITLIELFAWMTEMIVYRLNRVPEKNYRRFLDVLGVQLQPASSARAELTFRLSAPFPITPEDDTVAFVPQGTEVATRLTEEEQEITFTTDEKLTIVPPTPVQLRRERDVTKNYLPRLGLETFYAFDPEHPQEGDTFYLGFDETQDISGHVLQLAFTCEDTQATGIRREDPPLVWECSTGNSEWEEVPPSARPGERDTTGGLNNPQGELVFYLPLSMVPEQVHGRAAHWLRCRFEARRPEQGKYTQSPRILDITAHTLGATTRATHAVIQEGEILGRSNGEPGQAFTLAHVPILALQEGERAEVEEIHAGEVVFVPWEQVPDFAASSRYDRHFTVDTASGEVCFGPAVQQPDGTVRQYGRVPEAGRRIRFGRYRYGGGTAGNVPAGRLQVLKTSLPYIDRVTNLRRAEGGRDPERLEEATLRARREMRAQQRAVTAEDFESFGKRTSRAVARVKCRTPDKVDGLLPPGMIELLVVPAAFDGIRVGDLSRLRLEPSLREEIVAHLDPYRLLTTTLNVKEPRYLGVKVTAQIVPSEYSRPETVRDRVVERLRHFITPLALGDDETLSEMVGHTWEGWPFGRDLYVSELFSLIQQVPGVKHVLDVQVSHRQVVPRRESRAERPEAHPEAPGGASPEVGEGPVLSPAEGPGQLPELTPVEARLLKVPADTVLCSLDHDVEVVYL